MELEEALKIHMHDAPRTVEAMEASRVVDQAARLVANPNIEAQGAIRSALEGEPRAMADGFRLAAKLLNLTEQTRTVMGQDDDGTPNGKDYTERRLVSEWAAYTTQGDEQ